MSDSWEPKPETNGGTELPGQDEIDKRLEEIKRIVMQGASEAQVRIKRAVDSASAYLQQTQTTPAPRQATSVEEHRIRQLVNMWSDKNWRVARELGSYMDVVSWSTDEVWEATLQTRWETRSMEVATEPYTGRPAGIPQPLLPVWDYELPEVVGLKAPETRTRLAGLDEVVACTNCNGTGRALCSNCSGRGWIVCPDCKGRTKIRCATCRGRGYVADWTVKEKKPFFRRQAENVASSVGGKVADMFENIRLQGVPIPNPLDADPAAKGPTVPCPDCINGEVDCTCGNGKRVCAVCQGARMSLCNACGGTGKLVRHSDIVRRFDLRTATRIIGACPIPQQQLTKADGELVYNAEVNEMLHPEAPPERVPLDVWQTTVALVAEESQAPTRTGVEPQASSRPTLQVIELVRIPYTKVLYRYADQDYLLYIYDCEGHEKFFADRYPARWDRIERLVKAISSDLLAPMQPGPGMPPNPERPYSSYGQSNDRASSDVPSYSITEEKDDDNQPEKQ
ncbi:MAG: hypothetical protein IMW89_06960 [Ktedonobacteraceae bacterium]|nr:hypothetical protein [Ktedonobacteraceae bacterium]